MEIDILSLFPEYFLGPFDHSMIKHARTKGLLSIRQVNIRDFTEDKHHKVDDRPYGGGPGMVMMPQPIYQAIHSVKKPQSKVIYFSPQGTPLTAKKCQEMSKENHLILLCGHYEGVDERIIENEVDEEISIGDFVLTNGGLAAIVFIDSMIRFLPGVIGDYESVKQDSFSHILFDHPHYTRPEEFNGWEVPKVLLEGNHQQIAQWRLQKAIEKTHKQRPDLFLEYMSVQGVDDSISMDKLNLKTLYFPCENLKKTISFYKKIVDISDSGSFQFQNGCLNFFQDENFQNQKIIFEFRVEDREILRRISYKLRKTSFFISEQDNQVQFKDPNNYFWRLQKN